MFEISNDKLKMGVGSCDFLVPRFTITKSNCRTNLNARDRTTTISGFQIEILIYNYTKEHCDNGLLVSVHVRVIIRPENRNQLEEN